MLKRDLRGFSFARPKELLEELEDAGMTAVHEEEAEGRQRTTYRLTKKASYCSESSRLGLNRYYMFIFSSTGLMTFTMAVRSSAWSHDRVVSVRSS